MAFPIGSHLCGGQQRQGEGAGVCGRAAEDGERGGGTPALVMGLAMGGNELSPHRGSLEVGLRGQTADWAGSSEVTEPHGQGATQTILWSYEGSFQLK